MSSPTNTHFTIRQPRENHLYTAIRQYPRKPIAHPTPYQVRNPFGPYSGFHYADLRQPLVALPIVIQTFQRLVDTFLSQPQPSTPQPREAKDLLKAPEDLSRVLQSLLLLQGQIKVFGRGVGEALPKELVRLLLQIDTFVRQLEQLIKQLPRGQGQLPLARQIPKEELQQILKEFVTKFPAFAQTLRSSLPQLPKNLPPEVRQAVKEFLQEPDILALQKSAVQTQAKEQAQQKPPVPPRLLTEEALARSLIQTPKTLQTIKPEVLAKVYPHFIPGALAEKGKQAEQKAPGTLTQAPPVQGAPAPVQGRAPNEIPIFSVGTNLSEEVQQAREMPPFSTDIPFAFIVPFYKAHPIVDVPFQGEIKPKEPGEDIEPEDEATGDKSFQLLVFVPGKETWYGDPMNEGENDERPLRELPIRPFSIGVYPVTNQQFVDFLSDEAKKENLSIDKRGYVRSSEGTLLCQVKGGNIHSDIEAEAHKRSLSFSATEGKEACPVACVTYFGAKAFCEAGGFRLPSEIEWEKAGAVQADSAGGLLRKFRYGFQKDLLDPSYATYEESSTTPVGLYNGQSTCMKGGKAIPSANGMSPYGCYDMSGNVWEWTSTEGDKGSIVKGGSFQSDKYDLRISRRVQKDPGSLDQFTGFRVARS